MSRHVKPSSAKRNKPHHVQHPNVKPTLEELSIVHPNAAGMDLGAEEIWVCVPADRDAEPVRAFGTFTPDLHALVDWLAQCEVDTAAMESTGVYWIPIYELLEARGIKPYLVNARQVKNVPGRKTDVLDCQWLQKLHRLGLLSASFRPDAEMVTLRAYLRHRAELIERRAPHILHMQKALLQMNLQLTQVLTDITGTTGLAIIRTILTGERNPLKLAQLRNPACQSSTEEIAKALTGTWKPEYIFVLMQSVEGYDFYTQQLAACDAEVERLYAAIKPRWEIPEDLPKLPPRTFHSHSKNQPAGEVRQAVYRIVGVDLTAVDGLKDASVQEILSEIGTDMSPWPTVKHFASWLRLAPHNDISGGVVLRSRVLKSNNRARQAFRQAAESVARSDNAFGEFYRRKRAQYGPKVANMATAHKIARVVYFMLKNHVPYEAVKAEEYVAKQRERELTRLKRQAAHLGYSLTPHPTATESPVA
jgi:transposase